MFPFVKCFCLAFSALRHNHLIRGRNSCLHRGRASKTCQIKSSNIHNAHTERANVDYLPVYRDYCTDCVQDLHLICHSVSVFRHHLLSPTRANPYKIYDFTPSSVWVFKQVKGQQGGCSVRSHVTLLQSQQKGVNNAYIYKTGGTVRTVWPQHLSPFLVFYESLVGLEGAREETDSERSN